MKAGVIKRHLFNPGSKELTLALGWMKLLWVLRRSLGVLLLRTGTGAWWMNSSCGSEFLCNPQAETSPEKAVSTKFINLPAIPAASELLHQQPVNKGQDLMIYVHTWRKACIFYIKLTDIMNVTSFHTHCLSWVNDVQKRVSSALIMNLLLLYLLEASLSLTINLILPVTPPAFLLSLQSSTIPA